MHRILLCVLLVVAATAGSEAQQHVSYFAAAASAPGKNGTFFLTDARVFNPSTTDSITVSLAYLPADSDNTGVAESTVTIPPRQAVALDDLVGTTFGRTGAGGVRLRSAGPFDATSRTYNIGDGTSGTFGQFIPAQGAGEALQQGILLQVVNDPVASGFRSNIGFLNVNSSSTTVQVRVYDASAGELVGEGSVALAPLAYHQINDVFQLIGAAGMTVRNATVEFTTSRPVLAYASVVDNTSGDAVFITPFADTGTPQSQNSAPDGSIVAPIGSPAVSTSQSIHFVGSSSDPDGDGTSVEWDFGDGVSSTQTEVDHTFDATGSYTVRFFVTDSKGLGDPTPATLDVEVVQSTATLSDVQSMVFSASCALSGCHAGSNPQQGQNLSPGQTYSNIVNVASHEQPSLNRIEPYSPEASYLWLKVNGDPSISGGQMPLGGPPLSESQLESLRSWIRAGARND